MNIIETPIGNVVDNTLHLKEGLNIWSVAEYFNSIVSGKIPFGSVSNLFPNNNEEHGRFIIALNNCIYEAYIDRDGEIESAILVQAIGYFEIASFISSFNENCFKHIPRGYPVLIPAMNNLSGFENSMPSAITCDTLEFEEGTIHICQDAFRNIKRVNTIIFPSTIEDIPEYLFAKIRPTFLKVKENNPKYFDIDGKMIVQRKDMCLIKACKDVKFIPKEIKKIGPRALALCGDSKNNSELIFEGDIEYMGYNSLSYSNYSTITFLSKSYPLNQKIAYNSMVEIINNSDTDIFKTYGDVVIPTIIGYCYSDIFEKSDYDLVDSYITYMQYYFEDIKKCLKSQAVVEFIKKHINKFNENFIEKVKKMTAKGYYKNIELFNFLSDHVFIKEDEFICPAKKELMKKYIIVKKHGVDTIVRYLGREKEIRLPVPSKDYYFKFNDNVYNTDKKLEINKIVIPGEIEDAYFTLCSNKNLINTIIFEEGVKRINKDLFYSSFKNLYLPKTLAEIYSFDGKPFEFSLVCNNSLSAIYFMNGNDRYCVESFSTNYYTQYYLIDKSIGTIIYYPNYWENRASYYRLDIHNKVKESLKYNVLPRDLNKTERRFMDVDLFRENY